MNKKLSLLAGFIMMLLFFIGVIVGISLVLVHDNITIFISFGAFGLTLLWLFLVRLYNVLSEEENE